MRINFLKASILTIFILGGQWLLLSSNVEAVVLNNDFSDEHTYPNKEWEEIVEVLSDENDYDFDRVQTAIDGLEALPDFMLDTILEKEIGIKIINFAISDLVGFSRFENEKVPGLSDDATFRDDVSGLYYVDFYESVIIARSDTANETISTLYHEVGHAMSDGDFEFTNLKHPDIKEIHKEEKENIFPDDNYYDDIGEYYAESFSYYFTEENKDTLLEKAPRTYEYIDKFVNYPLIVDESDMEKIKIKWPDYEGATSYDVYKDGKKIDNVEDTFYSDSDYNEETHIYTVKALDENKNEIFDYYEFRITTMWLEKKAEERAKEVEEWEDSTYEYKGPPMRWFDNLMAFFNFSDTTAVFIYFGGLFAIIVAVPLAIVLLIIMMIRRKRKKNKKNEKSVS